MKAHDFLKNYLEDLEYLASCGLDSINHSTNGTPVFKNKQEFEKYISTLKKCIGVEDHEYWDTESPDWRKDIKAENEYWEKKENK